MPPTTLSQSQKTLSISLEKELQGAEGPFSLKVDFQLHKGEWVALLGPSGAGKTSLLRILAGLMSPDTGRIEASGELWLDTAQQHFLAVRKRHIGFVFQDYALFPHMSVRQQLEFAQPRKDLHKQNDLLDFIGLNHLANALPAQLSGGQQQRLALARALASEPDYLLLDEPLSALDTSLRQDLQAKLTQLRRGELGRTAPTLLIVTHDPGEALKLTDRVLLLEKGLIANDTSPQELFGLNPKGKLILNGRVIAQEHHKQGVRYRIEAGGHSCWIPMEEYPGLATGTPIFITAEQLTLHPVRLHSSQATQPEKYAQREHSQ